MKPSLKARKGKVLDLLVNNPLKERIASLFEGRVGKPFSTEELNAIYHEGKDRFAAELPPGYADRKDKPEPRCYGDLVIWKAVIAHIGGQKRPCLMVTADVKEDWFLRISGRTIGPRPELIAEMAEAAEQRFYMYSTAQFLQLAGEYLGTDIPESAIREVRDVARARVQRVLHVSRERRVVLNYLRRQFGIEAHQCSLVRVRDHQELWIARLPDGRRVLVEHGAPERFAIFGPWPAKPDALHVSPELHAIVQPEDLAELPWLAPALEELEHRHALDQARRTVVLRGHQSGIETDPIVQDHDLSAKEDAGLNAK
jgi:hypothetical protein